ncbi:MAG: orotidine-5'-phosphate decarboxylase [Firmicutes bacterium]|nr:orotidine-5'-phosphate decarboxylase [Bacillota bacterium]
MTDLDATPLPFTQRYFDLRSRRSPLVMGIDPAKETMISWGLDDSPSGLKEFCDRSLEVAAEGVGLVKFQSAFFERLGWRGMQVLSDSLRLAKEAGLLVILDVKRGDIGSTASAYGEAFFSDGADFFADAVTLSPYLGVEELTPIFQLANEKGGYVFVVARSSNEDARSIQQLRQGDLSVEEIVLEKILAANRHFFVEPGGGKEKVFVDGLRTTGPVGAVFAPNHGREIKVDLADFNCLFLAPGIGAQGATISMTADVFSSCREYVLPSVSRAILRHGPGRKAMSEAIRILLKETEDFLG